MDIYLFTQKLYFLYCFTNPSVSGIRLQHDVFFQRECFYENLILLIIDSVHLVILSTFWFFPFPPGQPITLSYVWLLTGVVEERNHTDIHVQPR